MRTEWGHTVTADESDGALVRVNGVCVAYFTGWNAKHNQAQGRELAIKIFDAIQRGEQRYDACPSDSTECSGVDTPIQGERKT